MDILQRLPLAGFLRRPRLQVPHLVPAAVGSAEAMKAAVAIAAAVSMAAAVAAATALVSGVLLR